MAVQAELRPPPPFDVLVADADVGGCGLGHGCVRYQPASRQYRRKAVNMHNVIDFGLKWWPHSRTNVHYSLMVTVTRFIHKNPLAPPPAIRHYCRDWRVDGQFTALTWRHSL